MQRERLHKDVKARRQESLRAMSEAACCILTSSHLHGNRVRVGFAVCISEVDKSYKKMVKYEPHLRR